MRVHSKPRPTVALVAVLGLSFGLAACGPGVSGNTGADNTAADNGSVSTGTDADGQTNPGETDENAQAEEAEELPALDHQGALTAGFAGDLAIECVYIYDAEEARQQGLLSGSENPTPQATLYLDGDTVFWEIPQPDGKIGYVLSVDGFAYLWTLPGSGSGLKAPDPNAGNREALKERMTRNAHDCKAYDGPASIFEAPTDIEF